MKHLPIALMLLLSLFTPMMAQELYTNKEQENIRKFLVQEGFPNDLLKNYQITPKNVPQLLRILAIYNSYNETHQLMINYDTKEKDWILSFKGYLALYWANGRLLPLSEVKNSAKYRSYISYQWSEVASDMSLWPLERLQRFTNSTNNVNTATASRVRTTYQGAYHHILYGGNDRSSIEAQLVEMEFLGTALRVHKMIQPSLERILTIIMAKSQEDPSLKAFLATLTTPSSYYWRNIAGTSTLSYHSYGIAVDINPKQTTKPIYWLWERARNPEWFLVSPNDRWQLHPVILQAFLDEGFLWGGSWPQYDIMHFEYRPELKELARLNQRIAPLL